MIDSNTQADILSKYLINQDVDNGHIYDLYGISIMDSDEKEHRLITFAFDHPGMIPFLDAALAFLRPHSELRRRIYIIFAILESMPEYSDMFLPPKFNFIDTIGVFFVGVRAVFRVVVGIIIVKVARL